MRPGRPDTNRDRYGRSDRYNRSDEARVNSEIRAREVRLIDADGTQLGIVPIRDALNLAGERDLDLVEVAPNADPPVCRLMNYGKYLYEKQKRERESRKAHKQIEVKEVQMGPKTDEHDIQVILNRIRKFAKEGAKIRVRVKFKGREIYHPEVAQELLQRVAADAADAATVESMPAFDGKSLIMILTPVAH
ncbi:MAG TPA: translation initiation factor IF-3 [Caldilineaceae bacterium]|nr:translation initiation factor IF-3 [Caldilineaceae bacterium]